MSGGHVGDDARWSAGEGRAIAQERQVKDMGACE